MQLSTQTTSALFVLSNNTFGFSSVNTDNLSEYSRFSCFCVDIQCFMVLSMDILID